MPLLARACAACAADFPYNCPRRQGEALREERVSRIPRRPLEGPPGAADNLVVAVGRPHRAAVSVMDGVAEKRLVFVRGQGAPVPREEVLAKAGPPCRRYLVPEQPFCPAGSTASSAAWLSRCPACAARAS